MSVLLGSLPGVTEDASPDEPEKGERQELTAEEREKLRRLVASLQGIVLPKFDFKIPNIVDTSAFAKLAADAAKLSSFALPESMLSSFAAVAMPQSRILDSFKPVFDMQSVWKKQFEFTNSDFFKTHAATQVQFAKLGANLTKTFDFGISDSLSKITQQFAAQQSSWLKTLGPTLDRLRESFYPPNLRGIDDLKFEDVEKVVMADSIALYGVPRTAIAEALIRTDSAAKRREILGRRWKAISADCREAIDGFESEAVAPYSPFALAALDALDGGHTAASQALAGSLIDSLLTSYFGKDRGLYTPDKHGKRTTKAYDEFTVRQFVAFAPMWQTYQQFWVGEGDTVPTTFSRNATAHTVSPRQFNRRNTVQAMLFATSLLYFFDRQDAGRKAP